MRRTQFLYDGLFRCLCPAVDRRALRETLSNSHRLLRPVPRPTIRGHAAAGERLSTNRRRYGTEAAHAVRPPLERAQAEDGEGTNVPGLRRPEGGSTLSRLLRPTPPSEAVLNRASEEDIVAALEHMRTEEAHRQRIDGHERLMLLINRLLRIPDYALNSFIYECMMEAMAYPKGSTSGIKKILRDMAEQGVLPTVAFCQSALAALAIHPDYVLRRQILDIMGEFWHTVDQPARQKVVLGMLRDQQYELAYLRLTDMIKEGAQVDLWVYDIFIMTFGRLGFLDEMLSLLHLRRSADHDHDMVPNLLHYTLDVCSQAYHHPGTAFAWVNAVKTTMLRPSDGIVENVLATAARHGDVELATEALELLSSRARVRDHHYEATAEAFVEGGDMQGAIRIFCIMKRGGYTVERQNITTLCHALKQNRRHFEAAETALRNLYRDNAVPVALACAVIEAKAEELGSESTMELYRDVPLLCGEDPTPAMAQNMIIHSRSTATRSEMIQEYKAMVADSAADETPRTPLAYDALIPPLTAAGELDLAFRLASQAVQAARGSVHDDGRPPAWIKPLVDAAVEGEDGRIWGLMDELEASGDETAVRAMRWTLRHAKARQGGS